MKSKGEPLFGPLSDAHAPVASRRLLEHARSHFGFVPNMLASLAHSPTALGAYLSAELTFQGGTLTSAEQQIVLLTASRENSCNYCVTAHGEVARFFMNVPTEVVAMIQNQQTLDDPKLDALVFLTREMVTSRGHLGDSTVARFLKVGYPKEQLLEVLIGVSLKTISNYFDHMYRRPPLGRCYPAARIEQDDALQQGWKEKKQATAAWWNAVRLRGESLAEPQHAPRQRG